MKSGEILAVIENKDRLLPAGLSGIASFKLPPWEGTTILPNNTLIIRQGKPVVATVNHGKVTRLEVLPGKNLGSTAEIFSASLTPETAVIVNPNAMLKEGDLGDATPAPSGKQPFSRLDYPRPPAIPSAHCPFGAVHVAPLHFDH